MKFKFPVKLESYKISCGCAGVVMLRKIRCAHIMLGLLFAMVAALGYSGSQVFYNAYLPEIAEEKEHDRLSARGFSYGYVGSVILQLICLFIVSIPFEDATFGARLSFLLVGLWWISFAQIPFSVLPKGTAIGKDLKHSILYNGFYELKKVYAQLKLLPALRIYLLAFFFYSMGVMTVMLVAAEFAVKEISMQVDGQWVNLGESQLITSILLIQFVAIAGATLMARLSDRIGNIPVLMITVGIWIGICVFGYYTYTANQFYVLASCVGLVMGGIQSMSRSTYSKMMPVTKDTASFFSFYNVAEKLAMAFGLFFFGLIEDLTGSMRNSVFALGVFFLIGLALLFITRMKVTYKLQI